MFDILVHPSDMSEWSVIRETVMARYQKPNWLIAKVANPAVQFVIRRLGWSPLGAHVLDVRGRKSGTMHGVPVNPVELDGRRYLFAPRGETQWVRNFRAAGEGTLNVGGRSEPIALARELGDEEKPPVIRAYLDRWHWQVAQQVGVPKDATAEQLAAIAPNHPVFEFVAKGR
jgi:deazaflavin-dependent oxidoreductase (nitroreductase family)